MPSRRSSASQGTLGRDSQHDVVLAHRLRFAMRKLNPEDVPDTSINEAIEALTKDRSIMDRVRANREFYDLLRDGYQAEWTDENGDKRIETLIYLDLKDAARTTTCSPCSNCGSRATCTVAASTSHFSSTASRWC